TIKYKTINQAEQNPTSVWWHETLNIIIDLLKNSKISKESIAGVGCSGMFPVILPVNKKGTPLREGILYNIDTRSKDQIEFLQKKIENNYPSEAVKNNLNYQSVLPKIKWIKDNESDIWAQTQTILDARGYIVYKLTGEKVIDHYTAFHGGFGYSYSKNDWYSKAFEISGVDIKVVPQIKWPYEIAGYINSEAAKLTGLLKGTPVVTGTGDALSEMLSSGIYKTNESVLLYGSTMPIMTIVEKTSSLNEKGYPIAPSWTKNKNIISSGVRSGMSSFSWLSNLVGYKTVEELFLKTENLDKTKSSEDGLFAFPYFTSQIEPKSTLQTSASFIGLSNNHKLQHLLKSLIEGLGFSLRLSIEDTPGISTIKAVGGGAKSPHLLQTISDICNIEQQTIKYNVGAPLRAAWLAGYGLGILKEDSLEDWVKKDIAYLPHEEKVITYNKLYKKFKEVVNHPNKLHNWSFI